MNKERTRLSAEEKREQLMSRACALLQKERDFLVGEINRDNPDPKAVVVSAMRTPIQLPMEFRSASVTGYFNPEGVPNNSGIQTNFELIMEETRFLESRGFYKGREAFTTKKLFIRDDGYFAVEVFGAWEDRRLEMDERTLAVAERAMVDLIENPHGYWWDGPQGRIAFGAEPNV